MAGCVHGVQCDWHMSPDSDLCSPLGVRRCPLLDRSLEASPPPRRCVCVCVLQIRFEVCNRARDKYSLPRMTQLTARNVEFSKGLGLAPQWYTDVQLLSQSCGSQRDCGAKSGGCQRADVTVFVPTTCMFEDTRLHVQVRLLGDAESPLGDAKSSLGDAKELAG
jgi:hypothetical protein